MTEALPLFGLFLLALAYVAVEECLTKRRKPSDQIFTIESLTDFDGRHGVTYTACNGVVFDVTDSPRTNPCSLHHLFSGKDASLVLASMNFADDRLLKKTPKEASLSSSSLVRLHQWEEIYRKRFRVVGKMDYAMYTL